MKMEIGKAIDGKPYAGDPRVRFDVGNDALAATPMLGSLLYNEEQMKLIKVSPADFPLLTESITKGFTDKEWVSAGIECSQNGVRLGFRDSSKKHYAVVSFEHNGHLVQCAYKTGSISNNEDRSATEGVAVIGGLAAFAIGALTFPMITLGATAVAIGNALFSSTTEEKVAGIIKESLEETQSLINRRLQDDLEGKYDFFICHRWDGGGQYSEWLSNYYVGNEKKVFFFNDAKSSFYGYIPEVVCEAIRRSAAVILVLSPGFFDDCGRVGDPCRIELETALNNHIPILPIRQFGYRGRAIPETVPEHIRHIDDLNSVDVPTLKPWESVIDKVEELYMNAKRVF